MINSARYSDSDSDSWLDIFHWSKCQLLVLRICPHFGTASMCVQQILYGKCFKILFSDLYRHKIDFQNVMDDQ